MCVPYTNWPAGAGAAIVSGGGAGGATATRVGSDASSACVANGVEAASRSEHSTAESRGRIVRGDYGFGAPRQLDAKVLPDDANGAAHLGLTFAMSSPIIQASGLTKRFGKLVAVRDVTFAMSSPIIKASGL